MFKKIIITDTKTGYAFSTMMLAKINLNLKVSMDPFRDGHEGFWIFLKVGNLLEYQEVIVISFKHLQKLY